MNAVDRLVLRVVSLSKFVDVSPPAAHGLNLLIVDVW